MSIPLTKFTFYRDSPFLDFQNTIHFKSNQERDKHFDTHYKGNEKIEFEQDFNFIRDRLQININKKYSDMDGINYCRFKSERDNILYYAYVINYTYLTDVVTKVEFIIDPIMTFTQGNVLEGINNIEVLRQHLSNDMYEKYLPMLKTNDDVLKATTKRYVHQNGYNFSNFYVVFQCSVDLTSSFGEVDDPKIVTSSGQTRDKVTSPVDLYISNFNKFNSFVNSIKEYAWIVQNIKQVKLIPDELIEPNDLTEVKMKDISFTGLMTFKDKTVSKNVPLDSLKYSLLKLGELSGINSFEDRHMLRNEYLTLEYYSYDGQSMLLDCGLLDPKIGIDLQLMFMSGYTNEMVVYPKNYNTTDKELDLKGYKKGSFLNNSLRFNNFDDLPVIIDNYNLSLASSANQRQLTESKLLTNRIDNVLNGDNLETRFMDSVNLLSDVSIGGLFGKFTDEYEFYRQQQAEFKDLALQTPTITNQTNGNSFNIKNDIYGINFKLSAPNEIEINKIRKYYRMFGYEFNELGIKLDKIDSMSICNYVKFKGLWKINGIDLALNEQMKVQFENGVRLWHDNNTKNPMSQNILENKIIK